MSKLFSHISFSAIRLKNRIVMPAMGTWLANEDGTVSERSIAYYARRAAGGPGLIIVECCCTDPMQVFGPRALRISDDSYVPGLEALAQAIKAHGACAAIQLVHPGPLANPTVDGAKPVGPSPIPISGEIEELSEQGIEMIVDGFATGAKRAKEAGFEAVELHGAHGALICQFLSPLFNKRRDRYGGDVHGRATLALEIVARVKREVGRGFPVIFRISADEHLHGGLTLAETKPIAKLLAKAGVDVLSVSAGSHVGSSQWVMQPMLLPTGCLVPLAAEMREAVDIPVIAVGRINHPKLAENVLSKGKADLIAMGRALVADPDLPQKAMEGRYGEIRRCLACNACSQVRPIACLVNPEAGRELEVETRAERAKRVLVLGGGPAALEAARVARIRGHEVTAYVEGYKMSSHWSWLIKPYIREKMATLRRLSVHLENGEMDALKVIDEFRPDALIITMGSKPIVPEVPGISQRNVFLANDVLVDKANVGHAVAILGGGNIGCEVAAFLSRRGIKVVIIEKGSRLGHGLEPMTRRALVDNLVERGIWILTSAEVTRIQGKKVVYRDNCGAMYDLEMDSVVVALGAKPDSKIPDLLKDGDFEVFSVMHCEKPCEVYRAMQEGMATARRI